MTGAPVFLDAPTVRRHLDPGACTHVMREAMTALSSGEVGQLLRSFIPLGTGETFAIMPAALSGQGGFGAKLVSVFARPDGKTHNGLVVLFDRESGQPVCVADAGEITRIRTAAMSAAATDALARPDAARLALLGTGAQARGHADAIRRIRPLGEIVVWGRDRKRAGALAAELAALDDVAIRVAASAEDAAASADIICTVTASTEPVLHGEWLQPGCHVNLVGSSGPMAAEADTELLRRARVFPDHRPHVVAHGGEFLRAVEAGVYGEDRLEAEIGSVFAGTAPGRQSADDITVYKSLGHAVQDLAATAWLYKKLEPKA